LGKTLADFESAIASVLKCISSASNYTTNKSFGIVISSAPSRGTTDSNDPFFDRRTNDSSRFTTIDRGGLTMIDDIDTSHFIGGELYTESKGEPYNLTDPAVGTPILEVRHATLHDIDFAVSTAKAAAPGWAKLAPSQRALYLYRLADAMEADLDRLVELEIMTTGKPPAHARQEARFAIDLLRFCAGAARCLEGKAAGEYLPNHTSMVRREPLGVVAGIIPWNYPLVMLAYKVGPALATGNTMILKPSEHTPLTALRVARLSADLLPPGVLNVVLGDEVAGSALVRHPDIRLVSLTGSSETGQIIAREAAATLKRVHLELGGKSPVVVLNDVDLEVAAGGICKAAFYNAGQDCTAATRVIVERAAYDGLRDALVYAIRGIRVGAPSDELSPDMGPLISAEQRSRVSRFVEQSRSTTRLAGGASLERPGFYFAPTLLGDVDQREPIVQEEVFGPVLTLQAVDSDREAITLANGTRYGLGASVWTRDIARALTVANALEVGAVWVNCHDRVTPEMPHGGMKASGYGKDLSMYSLEEYTHVKHVMINLGDSTASG
jgi:1-pyrroline dehydrogenase